MPLPVAIPIGQSSIVVNAATTNAAQLVFSFQPKPGGGDFSAIVQATGTFSAGTGQLFMSLDGGTTYTSIVAAFDFAATKFQVLGPATPLIAGVLYRYTTAAFTGTSMTLSICSN